MFDKISSSIKKIKTYDKTTLAGFGASASDLANGLNLAAIAVDSVAKGILVVTPQHAGIGAILIILRAFATFLLGRFAKDKNNVE